MMGRCRIGRGRVGEDGVFLDRLRAVGVREVRRAGRERWDGQETHVSDETA